MVIIIKVLIFKYLNYYSFDPLSRFPQGEGRALRNSPVGYFSEGASMPRWAFPLGEGRDGGNYNKKVNLGYY
jgi:hypothetical protein